MVDNAQAASINELMDLDEAGKVGDGASGFDDQLWILLTSRIDTPEEAISLPEPVWVYLASRWVEWEVGNGGFPQAAYNIPGWLPLGERAYRKLGLNRAAELIAHARKLIDQGEARGGKFDADDIGELFEQFAESQLSALDKELDDVGWWADDVRLKYVRSNRDSFRAVDRK